MIKTRGREQSTQPAASRRKKEVLFMGKRFLRWNTNNFDIRIGSMKSRKSVARRQLKENINVQSALTNASEKVCRSAK